MKCCSFSPDKLFGVVLSPACAVHDTRYKFKDISRKEADLELYENICQLYIEDDKKCLGRLVGAVYYTGVRLFGWLAWYF